MKKKINIGNIIIGMILSVWGFFIVYPFYNSILVSFMSNAEFMRKPFAFVVEEPTLLAYKEIFSDAKFFFGYKNTLTIMIFKLPIHVMITSAFAYVVSRKPFFLKKTINNLAVFTMYFGGGIIPLYLTIKSYGMLNNLSSVIVTGIFGAYNMILFKNFFYTIPDSLEESAKIDGANDITTFFRIYVPLAKPIFATVSLFAAVSIWNEWYNAMLFLSESKKWPLQLVLREIIGNAENVVQEDMQGEEVKETFSLSVQMASVVVTMLPIMLVYPFLQKYFMSGLTVGAVKG